MSPYLTYLQVVEL